MHRDTTPEDSDPRKSISQRVHLCCSSSLRDSSSGPYGISANHGDPPGNPALPALSPVDAGSAAGLVDPASLPWTPRDSLSDSRLLSLPGNTPAASLRPKLHLRQFPRFSNIFLIFCSGTDRTSVPAVVFTSTSNSFYDYVQQVFIYSATQERVLGQHPDPAAHHRFFGTWRSRARTNCVRIRSSDGTDATASSRTPVSKKIRATTSASLSYNLTRPLTDLSSHLPSSSFLLPEPSIWTLAGPWTLPAPRVSPFRGYFSCDTTYSPACTFLSPVNTRRVPLLFHRSVFFFPSLRTH